MTLLITGPQKGPGGPKEGTGEAAQGVGPSGAWVGSFLPTSTEVQHVY